MSRRHSSDLSLDISTDGAEKMAQTLRAAQVALVSVDTAGPYRTAEHVTRLQRLIDQCEQHPPAGGDQR